MVVEHITMVVLVCLRIGKPVTRGVVVYILESRTHSQKVASLSLGTAGIIGGGE